MPDQIEVLIMNAISTAPRLMMTLVIGIENSPPARTQG
jgi:hypothetical protein